MSFSSMKRKLLGEPEPEPTLVDEINTAVTLSWRTRLIGFCVCIGIGLCLSILSMFMVGSIVLNPAAFAVPYTIGNILSLCSTGFLMGPVKQIKNMFNPVRLIATIIYIAAIAFTLYAAFGAHSALLVILAIFIQFCALIWYCLSYIPFARTLVKNCVGSLCA